jgi:peptide/nickel transport system substrate-binding protein
MRVDFPRDVDMRSKRAIASAILISLLCALSALNMPDSTLLRQSSDTPAALDNTLIWEAIGNPDGLDPHVNYEPFGAWIFRNVYETLFTCPFDSNSTTPSIPLLAESVDVLGDGLNYTFTLRQGITFHDGTPFNASCVYYNFMRILAIFEGFGPAWMLAEHVLGGQELADVVYDYGMGSVEHESAFIALRDGEDTPFIVLDTYRFRIRLSEPYAPFLSILAHPVCSIISPTWIEKHGGVQIGEQNQYVRDYTCGTGPYRIIEYKPGDEIVLSVNPSYWRMNDARSSYPWAGSIQTVIIRTNESALDREYHLLSGETDGCYWPIEDAHEIYNGYTGDPEDGTLMSSNPNLKVWANQPEFATLSFGFNMRSTINKSGVSYENPYRLKSLRKALSFAFDKEAVIAGIYNGFGIPQKGLIPKGMFGYYGDHYPYSRNITAAVEYWNDAMINGLDSILENDSYHLEIPTLVSSSSVRSQLVLLLKDSFETILDQPEAIQPSENLTIEIVQYEWSYYWYDLYQSNGIPVFLLGWFPDYGDPDCFVTPFLSSGYTYPRRLGLNESDDWDSTYVDQLIRESIMPYPETVRQVLYNTIEEYTNEQCPYLWICQSTDFHVERSDVYGYAFNPLFDPYFYHYKIESSTTSTSTTTFTIPDTTISPTHNLHWGIQIGDRFDFTISNTLTSEIIEELRFPYNLKSSIAYFITEDLPRIPSDPIYLFQVQRVIGTAYWSNGSEWDSTISGFSSIFTLPTGDWEFLSSLAMAQVPNMQIVDSDSLWGYREGLSIGDYSIRGLVLYEKSSGWLSQYLIEVFDSTNTTKLAEVDIRNLSGLTSGQIFSIISWSVTFVSLGVIVVLSALIIKHRKEAGQNL